MFKDTSNNTSGIVVKIMKKLFLASVAIVALTSAAYSADLDVPPMPAPAYDWSGFYFGGNIGYGASSSNLAFAGDGWWSIGVPGRARIKSDGVVGGLRQVTTFNWTPTGCWGSRVRLTSAN